MRDVTLANPCCGDGWQRDRSNNGIDVITMDETVQTSETEGDQQTREASSSSEALKSDVIAAIRECYDPEIPVNIYDLGLIYDLGIAPPAEDGRHAISVKMTLTAQGCGMGPVIADDAKQRIEALAGVSGAQVDIVWDPPWTPHMISPAGKQKLGLE